MPVCNDIRKELTFNFTFFSNYEQRKAGDKKKKVEDDEAVGEEVEELDTKAKKVREEGKVK